MARFAMVSAWSWGAPRSLQSSSTTIAAPTLLAFAPVSRESPPMERTSCTPGSAISIAVTRSSTASVRSSDALSGSWRCTKTAPLSSLGTNPPGSRSRP